jgi:hypothetical protein
MRKIIEIITPCKAEIQKYLDRWNNLGNYVIQEEALDKLYRETYPANNEIHEIIIKASALNDFYSTNIFSIYPVAKHILDLHVDEAFKTADPEIVNRIATVKINEDTIRNFYSFATKYCSRHKPKDYPIYDFFVDKLLRYFRDRDNFYCFNNEDLKDYCSYKEILIQFRIFYNLTDFDLKQIDKYLWQLGKEKFPRKY